MERVYLDWNATAPLREEAREAVLGALDLVGNPSSVHAEGRAARKVIEEARQSVAALVGSEPGNVIFTSGGTEANMLALSPGWAEAKAPARDRLLVSAIEHPSVRQGGRFSADHTRELPVDGDGVVALTALEAELQRGGRPLVSVMLANNETGVIQPISEIVARVHAAGALLHVDAVQAAGRIALNMNELGADLLTLSAHKIGGPKGVGALVRRSEALHLSDPLMKGGGQERNLRAGTENVAGIAGFGAAAAAIRRALASEAAHMQSLQCQLEEGLQAAAAGVVIFGANAARLPNTTLFSMPGMKAETAVIAFDLEGIALSSGSACSSGKVQLSHVLAAMGVEPALAQGVLRTSFGALTTPDHIRRFLNAWNKIAKSLGKGRGIAA